MDQLPKFSDLLVRQERNWWQQWWGRVYTRLLIVTDSESIRMRLARNPHLFNARVHKDYLTMAVFFNEEMDKRALITPDEVRQIMEAPI